MMVEFTVEMSDLRKHIGFVRNALGNSRSDLPVLMMRFEIMGQKAVIFTANKEIFCRTEMKVTRPEGDTSDGTFGVLGAKIEKLISQVEVEKINFRSDGSENLTIEAGFLTLNFEIYDSSTLKTVADGVKEHLTLEGLTVSKAVMEEAMTCARSCISTNSTKPEVNHMELRDRRVLSSDGRKILIYQHDAFPEAMTLKVPSSSLNDVLAAVKHMHDVTDVQVIPGKSYFYLKGSGNKFSTGIRKVERTFPAIEAAIKEQSEPTDEVSIDKNVLSSMVRGVALGLPYDDVRVQMEIAGMGAETFVEISALNSVGKRSHERASAGKKKDDDIVFPISFKHLLDTLDVFKGDSVVDMIIYAAKNMMIVRDLTEERSVLTLIPFRTDQAIKDEKKEEEAIAAAKKPVKETTPEPDTPALVDDAIDL